MIDKNKAYRFRGDSERWVYDVLYRAAKCHTTGYAIAWKIASHLLSRGILLEYPELPGEDGADWEFCDAADAECGWSDNHDHWAMLPSYDDIAIYCRKKKKPVYRSGKVVNGKPVNETIPLNTVVYWTTDPEKGKELLS